MQYVVNLMCIIILFGLSISSRITSDTVLIKVNKEFGITLLVIEHNMRVIMSLAQKIFCLAHGELIADGTPEEIKNDKRVIDAYLGAQ